MEYRHFGYPSLHRAIGPAGLHATALGLPIPGPPLGMPEPGGNVGMAPTEASDISLDAAKKTALRLA
jgi:hypothetical protein